MWHVPATFQAGLAGNGVHALQHASFLFSALLFWWAVLGKQDGTQGRGAAIVYLFTMSETVWYPYYGSKAQAFGFSALEDQQLGGLIMWIPGGLAYVAAGLVRCARWLARTPQGATVRERS